MDSGCLLFSVTTYRNNVAPTACCAEGASRGQLGLPREVKERAAQQGTPT